MSTETNSAETPVVESSPPETEPKKDSDVPAPSDVATDKEAPAVTEDVETGIEEEDANKEEKAEDDTKKEEEKKEDETSEKDETEHKENGKSNGTAVEAEKNGETEVAKAHKRSADDQDVEILNKKAKADESDVTAENAVTVE
jgi:hypothetical protein